MPSTFTLQENVDTVTDSLEYSSIFLQPLIRSSYLSEHSIVILGATAAIVLGTKKLFSRIFRSVVFFFFMLFSPSRDIADICGISIL